MARTEPAGAPSQDAPSHRRTAGHWLVLGLATLVALALITLGGTLIVQLHAAVFATIDRAPPPAFLTFVTDRIVGPLAAAVGYPDLPPARVATATRIGAWAAVLLGLWLLWLAARPLLRGDADRSGGRNGSRNGDRP